MRNSVFETVALATATAGLAYYLRSEMSDLAGVILDGPRAAPPSSFPTGCQVTTKHNVAKATY